MLTLLKSKKMLTHTKIKILITHSRLLIVLTIQIHNFVPKLYNLPKTPKDICLYLPLKNLELVNNNSWFKILMDLINQLLFHQPLIILLICQPNLLFYLLVKSQQFKKCMILKKENTNLPLNGNDWVRINLKSKFFGIITLLVVSKQRKHSLKMKKFRLMLVNAAKVKISLNSLLLEKIQ